MTMKIILALFILFLVLLVIDKLTRRGTNIGEANKKVRVDGATPVERSTNGMTEYSREMSYELGFNKYGEKFKRPQVLKRKGMTTEEESYLERCKMLDTKFSESMKNLIPLRMLHTEEVLKNSTIRVFIDTVNDTKIIARDHSAMLEIDLKTVYGGIAGEFVLINIDKEGEDLTINYVLADSSKMNKLN